MGNEGAEGTQGRGARMHLRTDAEQQLRPLGAGQALGDGTGLPARGIRTRQRRQPLRQHHALEFGEGAGDIGQGRHHA